MSLVLLRLLRASKNSREGTAAPLAVAAWSTLTERQLSSSACSTSYSSGNATEQTLKASEGFSNSYSQANLHGRHSSTAQKQLPGKSGEAYAEFTQLERLLQQYHQNMGAVGKAVTAFTQNLWRRRSASGKEYDLQLQRPEPGQNEPAVSEEELLSSIQEAELSELTTGIKSLAAAQQLPDRKLMEMLSSRLAALFATPGADVQLLIEAFAGLASLGYQPDSASLREVSDIMSVRLKECSAQDISSLTNSLAVFGWTHFPLMIRMAGEIVSRIDEFSSEALADVLYTYAILHCDHQQMVDTILTRILFDLKRMSPAALSQLVSGLHLLHHRDAVTDVFLDALAEAALRQLQHFSAKQLATLAYNYGTLNHWGRNDQELLDAITIRMLHQQQDLTPGQMANLVWALARASYASPRTNALLTVVCNHAADVVTEFSPEELTRLLHSLSTLSFHNQKLFEEAEAVILDRLDDFDAGSLALVATAFARLMHTAPRLAPVILNRMEEQYPDLSTHNLCGLVWAGAVLEELEPEVFEAANLLLSDRGLQDFTARDFMRLYQAELLMEGKVKEGEPPPRLNEWLRGYAINAAKDKVYLDRYSGNVQQEICRCLMRLGIPYTLENVVDKVVVVDVRLKIPEHPKIALKVEPMSKFTSSRPQRPLADAVIARRLLEARGWRLICVSEHEWVRLKGMAEKVALLEGKLKLVKSAQPSKISS